MTARPLERRNAARTAVVWDALEELIAAAPRPLSVIDIGGGTGGFAVRIAARGHTVTVVDPSPDALAAAGRRAAEEGLGDRVHARQGDLADLPGLLQQPADLVLCHGVLGLVPDPLAALSVLRDAVVAGGWLSVLVGQRHAAVLARAMAGHLREARDLLDGRAPAGGGERRFTEPECRALLEAADLQVELVHAVRVFVDLVPASALESEAGAAESLVELERAVARRPEYLSVAAQLHLLARR